MLGSIQLGEIAIECGQWYMPCLLRYSKYKTVRELHCSALPKVIERLGDYVRVLQDQITMIEQHFHRGTYAFAG